MAPIEPLKDDPEKTEEQVCQHNWFLEGWWTKPFGGDGKKRPLEICSECGAENWHEDHEGELLT